MRDKVVLVTGASSGIGQGVAHLAGEKGAKLVLVARNTRALETLARSLYRQYRTKSLIVKCDMSQPKQIENLVKKVSRQLKKVDILVNCAGYGTFKPARDFAYDEIVSMFEVNTFGMMYLSQLVLPLMTTGSHQFFVSSMAGKIATPSSSVYSATKSAIISYANALRLELKSQGIGVTTVNPGPVTTEFFNRDAQSLQYYEKVKGEAISVETVAAAIIQVAQSQPKRREINLPIKMSVAATLYQLFPHVGDYLALNVFNYK